jgi:hypothetical protein
MGVHEQRIQTALTELACDQSVFSALSGINQSKLSNAFKGVRDFSNPEIVQMNALIDELREIVQAAAPFPVAFKNIVAVKRILECRREGVKWRVAVEEVAPAGAGEPAAQ